MQVMSWRGGLQGETRAVSGQGQVWTGADGCRVQTGTLARVWMAQEWAAAAGRGRASPGGVAQRCDGLSGSVTRRASEGDCGPALLQLRGRWAGWELTATRCPFFDRRLGSVGLPRSDLVKTPPGLPDTS